MALGTKSSASGSRFELVQLPQLESGFPRVLQWGDSYKDVYDAFVRGDFGGPGTAQDRLEGPIHSQHVAIVKIRSASGSTQLYPGHPLTYPKVEVVASWRRVGRHDWRQDQPPTKLYMAEPRRGRRR